MEIYIKALLYYGLNDVHGFMKGKKYVNRYVLIEAVYRIF